MGMLRQPAFRSFAVLLALAAMLFRGLLPAGWMPGPNPAAPVVICPMSMSGMAQMPAGGKPVKHDHGRADYCSFGATSHFAPLNSPVNAPLPAVRTADIPLATHTGQLREKPGTTAHAARAPPAFA